MKGKRIVLLLLLVVVLAGAAVYAFFRLKSSVTSSRPQPPAESQSQASIAMAPSRITLDNSNSYALEMAEEGGHLSLTGADGTIYTLTIPEGAIARKVTIRMTPITRIDLPALAGKSFVALHLQPEGLVLLKAATLLIEPPAHIPLAQQIGFAYSGSAESVFRYPLVRDPALLQFDIMHFSGYGVAQGSPADAQSFANNSSSSAEANFDSKAAQYADDVRNDREEKLDADTAAVEQTLEQWYDQVVGPEINAAGDGSTTPDKAMYDYTIWEINCIKWTQDDRILNRMDDGIKSLTSSVLKAYKNAVQSCNIASMTTYLRFLGVMTNADIGDIAQDFGKCQPCSHPVRPEFGKTYPSGTLFAANTRITFEDHRMVGRNYIKIEPWDRDGFWDTAASNGEWIDGSSADCASCHNCETCTCTCMGSIKLTDPGRFQLVRVYDKGPWKREVLGEISIAGSCQQ